MAAAIHRLAADYDTTVQALGETAFKYLFEKLGEPSPAYEPPAGLLAASELEHA